MDDCPNCGRPSPIRNLKITGESHHVCDECLIAWEPPRNTEGLRLPYKWPKSTLMAQLP